MDTEDAALDHLHVDLFGNKDGRPAESCTVAWVSVVNFDGLSNGPFVLHRLLWSRKCRGVPRC